MNNELKDALVGTAAFFFLLFALLFAPAILAVVAGAA